MEHWLRDEAVDKCMKCSAEFTFTERKHHCRDCGKIFCHRFIATGIHHFCVRCVFDNVILVGFYILYTAVKVPFNLEGL